MNKKICEMVAQRIVEQMEKGVVPWNKPWFGNGFQPSVSHETGKVYSLLNQILLGVPGEYATFGQIKKAGGSIKKGEKGNLVVFWNMLKKEEEQEDGDIKIKTVPVLRYWYVFNVETQCEGIKAKYFNQTDIEPYHHDSIKEADAVVEKYMEDNPELTIKMDEMSGRAFYRQLDDFIQVPMKEQFENIEEFYSTLFHEMVHSTGSEKRLGRKFGKRFGDEAYGAEELVAEIGAAALTGNCGIETDGSFKNSVAYVQNWMNAIKKTPEMVIMAAGKAEKAVNYILYGNVEGKEGNASEAVGGEVKQAA